MNRRALRPIPAELDLSSYLLFPDDLPNPWDQELLFGKSAALEVEIGSGKGLFLANAAVANPQHHFLGIEVAKRYARYSAEKLERNQITNARMVSGDALAIFRELIPDESLTAVHVYFPDPWWKRRQRKRRVLREPLMKDIQRTLIPGGTLHFWTDVKEYYHSSLKLFDLHTDLIGPNSVNQRDATSDMDYLTHFERKTRRANEPVYRCLFRKKTE